MELQQWVWKGKNHFDQKCKADILNWRHTSWWTKDDNDDFPMSDDTPIQPSSEVRVPDKDKIKLVPRL